LGAELPKDKIMNKVLIFPGSFQFVKNYGNYDGWDIWLKPYPEELPFADYYIGHSEVDAGHDWNENISQAVISRIS